MVWLSFSIPTENLASFSLDWNSWLNINIWKSKCSYRNISWNIIFIFIFWHIWKWRCNCVFDSRFNLPHSMHAVIWASVDEWTAASRTNSTRCPKHLVSLQWHKPPHDTLKINVDGSLNHQGCIGACGLIRNINGAWCGGFTINLGTGDILQAEAWGLFYGLLLAIKSRAQKVEFESDSTILVSLIQQVDTSHHPLNTILSNCRQLLCNFSSASLQHIHREQNFAADLIAKASLSKGKGVIWLEDAPSYCFEAIQRDMSGASTIRIIPAIVDHGQLRGIHGDINADINPTETSNNGNRPFQNCEHGTTGQDQLMNPNFDEGVHGQIENLRLVVVAASPRSDIGASNPIISTTEGDITHGQCAPMCNGCLTSKLPPPRLVCCFRFFGFFEASL